MFMWSEGKSIVWLNFELMLMLIFVIEYFQCSFCISCRLAYSFVSCLFFFSEIKNWDPTMFTIDLVLRVGYNKFVFGLELHPMCLRSNRNFSVLAFPSVNGTFCNINIFFGIKELWFDSLIKHDFDLYVHLSLSRSLSMSTNSE